LKIVQNPTEKTQTANNMNKKEKIMCKNTEIKKKILNNLGTSIYILTKLAPVSGRIPQEADA